MSSEDERILSDVVASQSEELGRLKEENRALKVRLAARRPIQLPDLEDVGAWFTALVAVAATVGVLFCIWSSVMASGAVDYCYTKGEFNGKIGLTGSVNWREDADLGSFNTMAEAVAAAEILKCPLWKKP